MNPNKPILEAQKVSLHYGGFKALQNVDLSIFGGEFLSIVGPNGAGKSSLINVLTGLFSPTYGQVRFCDKDISSIGPSRLATDGLARTFQLTSVFMELTVRQTLAVAATSHLNMQFQTLRSLFKLPRVNTIVDEVAEAFGLTRSLDLEARSLPHGQRKLLDIASAYALHPKLMLLDEPTAGVSTADKHSVMATLVSASEKLGVESVVIVEHDMDLVSSYSHRVVAMQSGQKIADSSKEDFFNNDEVLSIVMGKGVNNVAQG